MEITPAGEITSVATPNALRLTIFKIEVSPTENAFFAVEDTNEVFFKEVTSQRPFNVDGFNPKPVGFMECSEGSRKKSITTLISACLSVWGDNHSFLIFCFEGLPKIKKLAK